MSLPRFLDRIVDATAPALGGLDRAVVTAKLEETSVTLAGGVAAANGTAREGFLLAANLLARLYPRIVLAGPEDLVAAAADAVVLINPRVSVSTSSKASDPTTVTLAYELPPAAALATIADDGTSIAAFARRWNVFVDTDPSSNAPSAAPAALLAAVIGVSEVFRSVFAEHLGPRGRRAPQPGSLNLVTLGKSADLPVPRRIDVGEVRLVGAGAIGQAAAYTLASGGAHGTLLAIDDEVVALSNLQRYVLTGDGDVGAVKVDLLRERLRKTSLEVVPLKTEWYADLVEAQAPTLVALDSPEARIGVQASLPGPIYNAWTQPADVGWSRHERFGKEACLACLYWPEHEVPSRHEQIATAFRQHPLRVLGYLVHRLPVGLPLPPGGVPSLPNLPAPPEAVDWLQTPLIDAIALAAGIDATELTPWRERPLADVYQDGICGGALLHLDVGAVPRDVLVPLAHQSVFAGVMVATQLIVASVARLKTARAAAVEARFDVLAGMPQVLARPRQPASACLCGDPVFREVYREKAQRLTRQVH
ncbi:MAG TPA: ThiF family adenylyltransferase [Solirubrobacteraceae bacterium]|nr:ThiF family adenylyltransferase [Solirubrobacteraceae bacterium]